MSSAAYLMIALGVSLSLGALIAVLSFRVSSHAIHALERAHLRSNEYTGGLIDRLMSMDFQTYKAYEMMEQRSAEDQQEVPRLEDVPIVTDRQRGFGSDLGLRALLEEEVESESS